MELVNLFLFALICEDSESNLIFASSLKKAIHRGRFDHQKFPKLVPYCLFLEELLHNDWMIGVVRFEIQF